MIARAIETRQNDRKIVLAAERSMDSSLQLTLPGCWKELLALLYLVPARRWDCV